MIQFIQYFRKCRMLLATLSNAATSTASKRCRRASSITLGKAVQCLLNEYQALTGYLRDGRLQIDNNLVENAVRPEAVGRRRWLFIGHPQAGWRSG
jgi:Transposase IS66 family